MISLLLTVYYFRYAELKQFPQFSHNKPYEAENHPKLKLYNM
jgi:hypothetical protein